jgi:hypothetical protein
MPESWALSFLVLIKDRSLQLHLAIGGLSLQVDPATIARQMLLQITLQNLLLLGCLERIQRLVD